MMNFGRAIGQLNRVTPYISKGIGPIGQVANIAGNVGQAIGKVRNIGSAVNDMIWALHHLVRKCKK